MNHYVHDQHFAQANHATRTAKDSAAFALPHIDAETRILDVGCGPGTITCDIAEHVMRHGGSADQVYAVDVSDEAIAATKKEASHRGLNIFVQQADTYRLPFEDNTFDVVYAHQILHHLEDPLAAMREWKRVVRPGGQIASREADYGAMTWYPPTPGLSRWRAVFSIVLSNNGGEANTGRHLPTWFHQVGLTNLKVSSTTWTYANRNDRTWLAESWSQRTEEENYALDAAQALNDLDESGKPGTVTAEAISQIVTGWNDWAQTPGAAFFMPHVEVLAEVMK